MDQRLETLETLLKKHDWTFEMSDDNRYWESGRRNRLLIKEELDKLEKEGLKDQALELFNKMKDSLASLNEQNYIQMNYFGH